MQTRSHPCFILAPTPAEPRAPFTLAPQAGKGLFFVSPTNIHWCLLWAKPGVVLL